MNVTKLLQPQLKDLEIGQRATGIYRIEHLKQCKTPQMRIKLRDRHSDMICLAKQALLTEPLENWHAVQVEFDVYNHGRFGKTGSIRSIRRVATLPPELVLDLLPIPKRMSDLKRQILDFVGGLELPALRQFVIDTLLDDEVARAFCRNPASCSYHHSERGGLLRHALEAQSNIDPAKIPDSTDRQLAKVAAFFHDIGKALTLNRYGYTTDVGQWMRHENLTTHVCAEALKRLMGACKEYAVKLMHFWTAAYRGQYGIQPRTRLVELVRRADRDSVRQDQRMRRAMWAKTLPAA